MFNIAIVTCPKRKNKVKDDILIKDYLLNNYDVNVEIVSWSNKKINWKKYNVVFIRSIWDYHLNFKEFKKWINYLKENNINTVNSINIISNNIYKDEQYKNKKYNMFFQKRTFIYFKKDYNSFYQEVLKSIDLYSEGELVLKPIVGASSYNVYKYNKENNNIYLLKRIVKKIYKSCKNNQIPGLIIEPFNKGIYDGEFCLVYLNGQILYCAKKFPSRFQERKETKIINEIPSVLIDAFNKIKLFSKRYGRIDFIIENERVVLMEVEETDPDLYLRLLNKEMQEQILKKISEFLISEMSKNG